MMDLGFMVQFLSYGGRAVMFKLLCCCQPLFSARVGERPKKFGGNVRGQVLLTTGSKIKV